MKKFVIFVVLVLLALLVLARLGIISSPESEPQPGNTTQTQQVKPSTAASAKPEDSGAKQEKGAVDSMLEYGVGYTQVKAKQRSSKKLDAIQQKHNQAIADQQ